MHHQGKRRKKVPRLVDHVPQKVAGYLDADEQRVSVAMADLRTETSLVEVIDEFLEFANCLCVLWVESVPCCRKSHMRSTYRRRQKRSGQPNQCRGCRPRSYHACRKRTALACPTVREEALEDEEISGPELWEGWRKRVTEMRLKAD